jgi:hypothetical protein
MRTHSFIVYTKINYFNALYFGIGHHASIPGFKIVLAKSARISQSFLEGVIIV